MIRRFMFVKPVFCCLLIVSLLFFGAAEDNSGVNESSNSLATMEESLIELKESLNNSKSNYDTQLRSFSEKYGINRLNLSIVSIVVILTVILFLSIIPGRKERLAEKEVIEDFDMFDDIPEAEEHEDLKTRINQLESDVKNQENDNKELLEKLGKANRLYSMNKADKAEKLVNEVEKKI